MNWIEFALHLAAPFVLGSLIGAERQWRQRMAGLRTNALRHDGLTHTGSHHAGCRQVVSGIGFLGGGVIMREGLTVRGLNTAATLWCSAAVGTLCGSGQVVLIAQQDEQ